MQVEPSEPPAAPTLRLLVPPDPKFGRYVRERVAGFASERCGSETDVDEFVTAVFEAFANALEHSGSQDVIELRCWSLERQLMATVVDRGVGFDTRTAAEPTLPDPLEERGRGLPIMRSLTDVFSVRSVPGKGTAIVLGRTVRRSDDSAQAPA